MDVHFQFGGRAREHPGSPAWVDEPYLAGLLRDSVSPQVVARIRDSFSGRDPAEVARRQQGYAILKREE